MLFASHWQVFLLLMQMPRYDLNASLPKALAYFTVSVQGLSRTHLYLWSQRSLQNGWLDLAVRPNALTSARANLGYNPDNDDKRGDDWNGENSSRFSRQRALPPSYEQDSASLDNVDHILDSIVRPYPAKTCGIPVRFEYDLPTGKFTYEWVVPRQGKATEESGVPSPEYTSIHFQPPLHYTATLTSQPTKRRCSIDHPRQEDPYPRCRSSD
ncbi:hypothetical protein CCMSSC00406_0006094 [Pleurotus cornucopiae]|uniref:Uncharacterized protein n=1 Tax=Pleurotus cornucopiae TaxID=5321 RepID=A0ACB7J9K9_PLECO|nr:hypothetical protein CCMSSC00406_0006094 [Pleurotus cornucopiae]